MVPILTLHLIGTMAKLKLQTTAFNNPKKNWQLEKLYLGLYFVSYFYGFKALDKLKFINQNKKVGKYPVYGANGITNVLPADWQQKKLGDICEILDSKR